MISDTESVIPSVPPDVRQYRKCSFESAGQCLVLSFTVFQIIYGIVHVGFSAVGLVYGIMSAVIAASNLYIDFAWIFIGVYFGAQCVCIKVACIIFHSIYATKGKQAGTLNKLTIFLVVKLLLLGLLIGPVVFIIGTASHGNFCNVCVYYGIFDSFNTIVYFITVRCYILITCPCRRGNGNYQQQEMEVDDL